MIDSYKHKGLREKLITKLREQGILDENVLTVMNEIPRHLFMESAFEDFAYEDRAFSIYSQQTISRPLTVAFQTQLLQVNSGEKVLEIGTGSGYQTAVLIKLKSQVFTIERQKELFDSSKKIFQKLNLNPKYQTFGDGYLGLPTFAPFDKIIVTCGAENIPEKLLEQLKIGGIMVIPLGKENQIMTTFLKIGENQYEKMEFGDFQFVPMLTKRN